MNSANINKILSIYRLIFVFSAVLSVALLVYVVSPFNNVTLSLIANPDVMVSLSGEERPGSELNRTDEKSSVTCDIRQEDLEHFVMCGLKFTLPLESGTNNHVSLNDSDWLVFNITAGSTSESYDEKVTILVKSLYDKNTSNSDKPYDNSQLKFHAVRFTAKGFEIIPLRDLKVETWWEELYEVPYEQAKKDFSDVVDLEVHIKDVPITDVGRYTINITKLEIHSYHLVERKLYAFLAFFWPTLAFVFLIHLVVSRSQQLERISRKAYHDNDTDLYSQYGFERTYQTYRGKPATLYLVKLTNWKTIANHFGPKSAHLLIRSIFEKIHHTNDFSKSIFARLSHDEIVILKVGERPSNYEEASLLHVLNESHVINNIAHLRFNVKVAIVSEDRLPKEHNEPLLKAYRTIDSILNSATNIQAFDKKLDELVKREAYINEQLTLALKQDAFHLLYMPLYDIEGNCVAGAEALIRCSLPSMKSIYPDTYIPIAEKSGLIKEIDFWVIEEAIKTLAKEKNHVPDNFVLSINLSSRELLDTFFIEYLKNVLFAHDVDAKRICIEITETFFVDMHSISYDAIDELRALGCRISLDDFGTGYTSFSHLMNIPIDEIKIDRSFVNKIHQESHFTIVKSIISIAHASGYNVVAEGVEDIAQLEILREQHCGLCQGYLLSMPVPFAQIIKFSHKPEIMFDK